MRIKTKYTYTDVNGNDISVRLVLDSEWDRDSLTKEEKMSYIQSLAELIGAIEPHQTLSTMEPMSLEEEEFWEMMPQGKLEP